MRLLIIFLLVAVIFISGCTSQPEASEKDQAISACIEKCKSTKQDLSNGPCLSNEIISNWVCDVAHSPRQAIDNQQENQCSAYREGKASHFVEVDVNCNLITTV